MSPATTGGPADRYRRMRGLLTRLGQADSHRGSGHSIGGPPLRAIRAHLQALLNCTQGDCLAAPDYGLPDLTDLLRDVPDSLPSLRQVLRQSVQRYEPRLVHVQVRFLPPAVGDDPTRLRFEIIARLRDDPAMLVRMTTRVGDGRHIRVE